MPCTLAVSTFQAQEGNNISTYTVPIVKQQPKITNADQQALGLYIEELLKSFNEHLSNITKAVVVDEENSFSTLISNSSTFEFKPSHSNLYESYLPSDLLQRIESVRADFKIQAKKLIEHFVKAKADGEIQNERKI